MHNRSESFRSSFILIFTTLIITYRLTNKCGIALPLFYIVIFCFVLRCHIANFPKEKGQVELVCINIPPYSFIQWGTQGNSILWHMCMKKLQTAFFKYKYFNIICSCTYEIQSKKKLQAHKALGNLYLYEKFWHLVNILHLLSYLTFRYFLFNSMKAKEKHLQRNLSFE